MKNPSRIIIAMLIVVAGLTTSKNVKAQNATLTVRLVAVLTMTVNETNPTLVFANAADYANGVSVTYPNALTVTSTSAYTIKVKAATADLTNGSNSIPVSNVKVQPTGTTGIGTPSQVSLSTTDQNIVTSAPAAILKNINLQYSTDANNAAFIGKPAGDYTTQITFTATAG
ncbi:hypothetical protein MKQ68_24310 [Chitinophaga horti]|uniref:MBG domain-containing protein n=1 Tax=Chitinophaga horti TaxID=2920382 RepID=A0ABY6J0Q4_9BACT|nr:hypothetical protein [Chitinophaga horti]UYQ93210.1 hypothetical protein MKQ68_24310 [Chitinophaga horti]